MTYLSDKLPTNTEVKKSRLWNIDVLGGLEMLRANYSGFSFSRHSHEQYMIAVTEGGVGNPSFNGGVHRVTAGDILVFNPGVVHYGGPKPGYFWRYRAFYPPAVLMARIANEISKEGEGIPQFNNPIIKDPVVAAKLQHAHAIIESTHSALQAEVYLAEALVSLIENHAGGTYSTQKDGREHRAIKYAKEYLDAFPMENISLESLSIRSGLSLHYFSRVFRKQTGLSPHRYQIQQRVKLAKSLLAKGMPISQAALETGFYDQPHLTRHFKRVFGVTPGEYRA